MQADEVRFMWLMVFFDLPTRTKPQRRRANRFRQFLKKDGYIMLQFSVYARVCRGQDAVDKHVRRVRTSLPKEGSVRTLQVTDRQYGRMELMLGIAPKTEEIGSSQMVLL
ncbi:CRISPR-associated protein Cas2 [Sphingomonas sp. MM-1]|uniref:CRISPR-associated endonuclease Cas2 n=1 Tax=Sphingomonas sp. MM-1 TaxID=745310 RepID=UPI0002C07E82|nr:CRISPR-associated endonuclease Cas2 [Sphingomonas sp. MM-1]AGH49280.1 CRISPR-associated protein Cas2 [Sphingomonas sp. MM-1]